MSLLIAILGTVLATLLLVELDGWGPRISHRLLRYAVDRLPENRRLRYAEEWLAHLEEMPTTLSRIAVSASFIFAAWRMQAAEDRLSSRFDLTVRAMDIIVASSVIIFLAPLLILAVVMKSVFDEGPLLWYYPRIGSNGKVFKLYSFAASPTRGPWSDRDALQAISTPFGWILAQGEVHTIPWFYSVIRGDASLVGPVPLRLTEVEEYRDIRRYVQSKPGLINVSVLYGAYRPNIKRRAAMDRLYARRKSIRLNLLIIMVAGIGSLMSERAFARYFGRKPRSYR